MIGTKLGNRYELLEKIGEGGMAVVYKAKCHLLNRYVAVKILKDEYSNDKEFVEKFKREAAAAASLSDNNIVNIYDVGTQEDINYIVMEYVKGKTLKEIIREEGKLPTATAINIASQIGKALECAHRNNIVHRDIKPHNILVTEESVVKVTDFGIAKASNSVTITNSSKIMGSAHYFSPEQARGSYVDCRTDIYSLGIVIYEMVTGRVPYDAESPVSVALKHIQEPVVPPKQLNERIPESLNKLILKAIEKEPIRRYQNVKDMISDLKKIENNQNLNISTNVSDSDMTRVMDPIIVNDKYKRNEEYDDESAYHRRGIGSKKRKTLIGAAIAILVVVIGAVSGYFAFSKVANTTETTVPNIVGMKQDEAKKLVEERKLKFTAIAKEKSDKPEGTVLRTYPSEGTKVKIDSEVRVSISGGQDKLEVPSLIGVDLNSAKEIISNSGLKLGKVTREYSDTISKNSVIRQTPDAETNANPNTSIDLVVSSGPQVKYIDVPNVVDKNIDEAASIISNTGVKISKNAKETNDKSQDGKVIDQSASGSVKEGTTITLTYYKYKEPDGSLGQNGGTQNGTQGKDGTTQTADGSQNTGTKPSDTNKPTGSDKAGTSQQSGSQNTKPNSNTQSSGTQNP
ncbi:Stk1 family PASTA domain-containing Ser/Thr kinase [Clostridiaceae bacterium UIB06]|uniref:non-specific serine/threonine protein kinase n=1 Tax=Clostridium thailandense TaxID=2794346 RepID=A0A949WTW5_9CLOT|nr:Stk1 family PASTA domain-containing Ser/Thr kinase [Clostridium thailandense]MBV7271942.1 Stk1 family PASTA domain-containing Ser/Thr kinase [Clostridium thailandense]MCH5137168.1 Stk1 family PASTA domain-containing Ser/Thr kinase [Clostridiaceae bacterium UIB06]